MISPEGSKYAAVTSYISAQVQYLLIHKQLMLMG